jgi:hypothetical protein
LEDARANLHQVLDDHYGRLLTQLPPGAP